MARVLAVLQEGIASPEHGRFVADLVLEVYSVVEIAARGATGAGG